MKKINISNPALRGALIAGMVILAIFAVIGLTKIVPKAISSIGSAFSSINSSLFSPKETISISLSSNSVKSGETVEVSFKHDNKSKDGSYEFKFDCGDKDISMILTDESKQIKLPCNTVSPVSSNSFKLAPELREQNSFVDSNIYITFVDGSTDVSAKNARKILSKTMLTVYNGNTRGTSNQTATSTQSTTTSVTAVKKTPSATAPVPQTNTVNVIRKSDLNVVSKGAGVVVNNVFIPKTTFVANEILAVRFTVSNIGNTPTGAWRFTALLPTYPSQVFSSQTQPSLGPGETIEYTLSFSNLAVTGNNTVLVNIDPTQAVAELSEANNTVVINLLNSGIGYNTGLIVPPYYNYNNSTDSDLMIRIIEKGYIEDGSNRFFEADSVSRDDRPAIRFEIENRGDEPTGEFVFTVELSGSDEDYTSPVQRSFDAGEKRRYTVDLEAPDSRGTETFTIRLDTNDNVNETRENNNKLTEDIKVD